MTTLAELRRLAERMIALDNLETPPQQWRRSYREFHKAASPTTILFLLDLLAAHERVAGHLRKFRSEAPRWHPMPQSAREADDALSALDALKEKNDAE